ncbi:hypothetical protein BS47DRAFT_1351247 [Hydnum rufescens UP504]|uniref:Uncharacterized protein n=1 Tax=Hydnum rufescens UP504 TaxID=1448309 RepID=A0A9P6AKY2_9AGAM|nr:hypothetical protein BS47DRAFT_1351247 [Hydnum rufescens UP504]
MCSPARARGVTGLLDTYCKQRSLSLSQGSFPLWEGGGLRLAGSSGEYGSRVDSPGSAFVII